MSELRKRMNDAMVLRGFAERTKQSYLACIVALAKHYRRAPESLDTAAIQAYLLHLISERKLAYASVNQAARAATGTAQSARRGRKKRGSRHAAGLPRQVPRRTRDLARGRLYAHDWVVYAKEPLGGPEACLSILLATRTLPPSAPRRRNPR